jgi:UDP:flavonoid glycosyltransferase YjiC (YdhE family)
MASLVFIIDMEEGHLIPSIGLAHELRSAGHDITYISVIDNEKYITQQGFRYYPIFEKSFPAGSNLKIKNQLRLKGYKSTDAPMNSYFEELIHYDFQWILRDLKPDLIIMSWVLCLEALILYYTWRINPVMLSPILMPGKRNTMNDCLDTLMDVSGDKAVRLIESITKLGYRFKSLLDFVNPSASFDEVIHCPRELKLRRMK